MHENREFQWWMHRAARIVRHVRWAWGMQIGWRWLAGLNMLAAVAVLWIRLTDASWGWAVRAYIAALFAVALFSAWRGRRSDFSVTDGLAILDIHHGLHCRLTAAYHGVGNWPAPATAAGALYTWKWRRPLLGVAASFATLAFASTVPFPAPRSAPTRSVIPPMAWETTQHWLDTLSEAQVFQPGGLDAFDRQLQDLRDQPMKEWYSHGSLEAAETLQQRLEAGLRNVETDLEAVQRALQALEGSPPGAGHGASTGMGAGEQFAQALDRLATHSAVPLDPSKFGPLSERVGAPGDRLLSAADWAELADAVERGLEACRACRSGGAEAAPARAATLREAASALGGLGRGPGEAPLTLSAEAPADRASGRLEALPDPGPDAVMVGDPVAVVDSDREHDTPVYTGPQSAGPAVVAGAGGDPVWRDRLIPSEQAVLKRYFR